MAQLFKHLLRTMLTLLLVMVCGNTYAMGDRSTFNNDIKQPSDLFIQNPALASVRTPTTQVVNIKLLQMRPTAGVGAGSILPFSIRDVRNTINPERRVAAATATPATTTTSTTTTTTPTVTITCADGTKFPTSGVAPSIVLNIPSTSGSCTLTAGPTTTADSVFTVNTFTSVSATITGANGWTVNVGTLAVGTGTPANTTIQISKSGVTYSMVLGTITNLAGSGSVTISSFTRL